MLIESAEINFISKTLERIAIVQEKLLEIAIEARAERAAISDKMRQAFKVPGVQPEGK